MQNKFLYENFMLKLVNKFKVWSLCHYVKKHFYFSFSHTIYNNIYIIIYSEPKKHNPKSLMTIDIMTMMTMK